LDASSVPFRQNMTDRICGSLDDILAYEDMQSVRNSYASQSAFMGKLLYLYCMNCACDAERSNHQYII
jgi:hypothetical protein